MANVRHFTAVHWGCDMFELIVQNLLLLVLLALYIAAIEFRDLLYSVILLAGASITLAVIFYMLHAPDIAITQAAVGAGVATLLYVNAVCKTRRREE